MLKIVPIPYEVKIRIAQGQIESSMYQAALDSEIDIRAIIELANAFQWSIDFAMDPRVGDTFKFIYEERFLDNKYIRPGKILAGKYINDGQAFYVYYFKESEKNIGFFDELGNSVQKMFLKAPVAYKYISSGYTTGPRYIAAFRMYTPDHRAIDYAAAMGTPIRAVGDGTVTYAGWKKSYGYFVSLHHNATYSTNYAHLSKPIVTRGQKVKQSQVIGYVGSTGFSTGPHLHFEMVKHGIKINPLREILPPGKPIKEENKERYFVAIRPYQEILAAE
jgi:murein DD-endopeptidase MepM/ murein hydrolase activator NlpD